MMIRSQTPCGRVADYRAPNQSEVSELKITVRIVIPLYSLISGMIPIYSPVPEKGDLW